MTNIGQNRVSTYDKFPTVAVPGGEGTCSVGWEQIVETLRRHINNLAKKKTILCVECYCGVDVQQVFNALKNGLDPALLILSEDALWSANHIDTLVAPYIRENDAVFGKITELSLSDFFDPQKVALFQSRINAVQEGIVIIVGFGSQFISNGDVVVYADLARWEAQLRFRKNQSHNLGTNNEAERAALQYQRAFFVDWRVCDRWKRATVNQWDYILDTNSLSTPKLAPSEIIRQGIHEAATRPFRVVPFFDPAPWGGQWLRNVCGLASDTPNFGWGFDCVPEENSILLNLGDVNFEIPSINVVHEQPKLLLGEKILGRFGAEFPIRFDFLDTMDGGNLSFQVHPLTQYIREQFDMTYTQDESYYILDAKEDASVYLGLREGIVRETMIDDLRKSAGSTTPFNADAYANQFAAKKHDHFLIPAGTCHCSGKNAVVLEISATPYIFTFKMWDWGRLGLDGRPRPIHIEDGIRNIQWERTTAWVRENLVNRILPLGDGDGWREEKTGLHEFEFIETRRHWFTKTVLHDTGDTVNVLNLIEGEEAVVESPTGKFAPFVVHYAETFIVPASVGKYTIRPSGVSQGKPCGTIKAFVR
ncbi:mannose-6-phosphate isomerase [Planctomycetales bacterium]|nr:mannose-6-phosphate isomerase [Planctomycetales bacterium]